MKTVWKSDYKPGHAAVAIRRAHMVEQMFPVPSMAEAEKAIALALLEEKFDQARRTFKRRME